MIGFNFSMKFTMSSIKTCTLQEGEASYLQFFRLSQEGFLVSPEGGNLPLSGTVF